MHLRHGRRLRLPRFSICTKASKAVKPPPQSHQTLEPNSAPKASPPQAASAGLELVPAAAASGADVSASACEASVRSVRNIQIETEFSRGVELELTLGRLVGEAEDGDDKGDDDDGRFPPALPLPLPRSPAELRRAPTMVVAGDEGFERKWKLF